MSIMGFMKDFYDSVEETVTNARIQFLYENRYNIARLKESEYKDWTMYVSFIEDQFAEATNEILKDSVNTARLIIEKETKKTYFPFMGSVDNETLH